MLFVRKCLVSDISIASLTGQGRVFIRTGSQLDKLGSCRPALVMVVITQPNSVNLGRRYFTGSSIRPSSEPRKLLPSYGVVEYDPKCLGEWFLFTWVIPSNLVTKPRKDRGSSRRGRRPAYERLRLTPRSRSCRPEWLSLTSRRRGYEQVILLCILYSICVYIC